MCINLLIKDSKAFKELESQLIILIVAGTVGLMVMAFSVVYFVLLYKRKALKNKLEIQEIKGKHQKEMLVETLKSQEVERNRLGTELHDGVGAMLSSIKLNLQVSQQKTGIEELTTICKYLDETIVQVRGISHQMMPIILKKYGLKRAIEDLVEKIASDSLKARITQWEDPSLNEDDNLMIYRIVQELINNTIKHSSANKISMKMHCNGEGQLSFDYFDNGKGFPEHVLNRADGLGLLNIRNRAQAINASATFENKPDGGVHVRLVFKTLVD